VRVKVPPRVLQGIEAVRSTGAVDMSSATLVRSLAMGFCFKETSFWIEIHTKDYLRGLKRGFEADESYTFEVGKIGSQIVY